MLNSGQNVCFVHIPAYIVGFFVLKKRYLLHWRIFGQPKQRPKQPYFPDMQV